MDFKNIETFLEVVKRGSFSEASISLYTTQPVISARIRQMEKELGTVLFLRNKGKKAILTLEGEKVYPYFKEGLDRIYRGYEIMRTHKETFGKIRFASPPHMGHHVSPNVLKSLYAAFPNIAFDIVVDTSLVILEGIKKAQIDIGLIYSDADEENESYTIVPLGKEKTIILSSPDHPLLPFSPLKITDLKGQKFIGYSRAAFSSIILSQLLAKHGLKQFEMIEIRNLEWVIKMVKNGIGISYLQRNIVEDDMKKNELVELPLKHPLPSIPISMIFRNEVPKEIRQTISDAVNMVLCD